MKPSQSHVQLASEVVQLAPDRTIGQILLDAGKLRDKDITRIFGYHKKHNIRFGEAAMRLRLCRKADIEYALSVQFDYPLLRRGEAVLGDEVIVGFEPNSPVAESIRELRSELMSRWLEAGRNALAIVSVESGAGKSFLAANLAASFAQLGENTLLIDADLRNPRQHHIFQLPGRAGLSTILSGRDWTEAIDPIAYFGNLSVLCAGPRPPNPLETLSRSAFSVLLDEVRRQYGVVLIDTTAARRGADARTVAARAGSALMVVRKNQGKTSEIDELRTALTGYGAELVGAVMNC